MKYVTKYLKLEVKQAFRQSEKLKFICWKMKCIMYSISIKNKDYSTNYCSSKIHPSEVAGVVIVEVTVPIT